MSPALRAFYEWYHKNEGKFSSYPLPAMRAAWLAGWAACSDALAGNGGT